MKYLFYTNTGKAPDLQLPHGISIRKRMPRMFVDGMTEMNLGKRLFLRILSRVTINTFKGVRPVFREYDCIRDGVVVCKAVLMSRMPEVAFMPKGGLFYTFGETLATERGKGYATLLHRYVLADNAGSKVFAAIQSDNVYSIKSAEKAGFVRYAEGYLDEKMTFHISEMDKIYLYGAGGHGKVIKEIIEACGGKVEAFVDDNLSRNEWVGLPVVHSVEGIEEMIVSIGSNKTRKMIAGKLGCRFGVAIHPSAIVSPSATIGEGTVVMPGAIVNADAVIGRHCIVNTGASVGHDCHLEDFCHVAPHATLCGTVNLGEGVWIGAGAVVNQNIEIGEWTVVGSASAVISNVEPNVTVAGVPARKI